MLANMDVIGVYVAVVAVGIGFVSLTRFVSIEGCRGGDAGCVGVVFANDHIVVNSNGELEARSCSRGNVATGVGDGSGRVGCGESRFSGGETNR